ncbi:MAG TPA: DUF2911 domain-containing protein [Opitutaceae bacterium]|nr:DUF2911 domain-containing protein [Opitutaceae bacterium]
MRFPKSSFVFFIVLAAGGVSELAHAQSLIPLPEISQRAVVSQRIGLTDITVAYHRALVGGRKVWDGLVPYGQVWRAGANENTTIEFSEPVSIEGHSLARGTYGLHMIPTADAWTIIFSKASTAWGAFSYDQNEDALRVSVKSKPSEMHEALTYEMEDLKSDSVLVTLKWEKLAVPFVVSTSDDAIVQKIREELRGGGQFYWETWNEAAFYCVVRKINLEEALKWADQSIQIEERFETVEMKSRVLAALNRQAEATKVLDHAMQLATSKQLYFYGRQLQFDKKPDEAFAVFRTVAKRFPNEWIAHAAQARLSSAAGDFETAIKEIKAAQAGTGDEAQKKNFDNLIHRLEAKQDINK